MNAFHAGAVLLLALGGALAQAADRGIYTVVEGDARVLPATTWYRLEPGTRAENGDVIDAGERAYVQAELSGGGTRGIVGPALAHMAALPLATDDLGTSRLAVYLGPIAKVVARNAARQARDSDEFVQLVAEHIGTQERNAFLNEPSGE